MTAEEGAPGVAARELPIDRQLPQFEARTFSALLVDASTERTHQAVRALDPDRRGRPSVHATDGPAPRPPGTAGAATAPGHPARSRGTYQRLVPSGLLLIDEAPGAEFVIGMIGKSISGCGT